MILNCARRTRASCCLLCIVTLSRSRELPDCPSLRASDEHSFIVRVLRARRMVWQLPCRLLLYIFQANPSTNSEAFACFGNSLVESGIVFKPKVKPIIFGLKANESPGRLSMACDHHLFLRGEPQIFRQVIFHFRERNLFHVRFPFPSSHACGSDLITIASTSSRQNSGGKPGEGAYEGEG